MPEVILEGHGRPNVFLAGEVGQKYKDLDSGLEWVCRGERGFIRVDGDDQSEMYNWDMIESGGGGKELLSSLIDRSISGTLEIPEGITKVGEFAFKTCQNLEKVIIPEGTTTIGSSAFFACNNLVEVSLPHSLTDIRGNAFESCTKLEKVNFEVTGLRVISSLAFSGCNLKEITLPDTITDIDSYAFASSSGSSITTINVPWAEGAIYGAPWGADNATINYNYVPLTE